jgi:hypothetical protein
LKRKDGFKRDWPAVSSTRRFGRFGSTVSSGDFGCLIVVSAGDVGGDWLELSNDLVGALVSPAAVVPGLRLFRRRSTVTVLLPFLMLISTFTVSASSGISSSTRTHFRARPMAAVRQSRAETITAHFFVCHALKSADNSIDNLGHVANF